MTKFNVRVYGLWLNEKDEYLISDERMGEHQFTKFPGGGIEKEEGSIDSLKREWLEEMGLQIEILSHFYTSDFYVPSAFFKDSQVISIYYRVKVLNPDKLKTSSTANDFTFIEDKEEAFRWIHKTTLNENIFNFPIDKKVARMLSASHQ